MSRRLSATETKAKLLSLLDEVANGEEIEITKHGRSVARLVPVTRKLPMGWLQGIAWTTDPEDDLIDTGLEWEIADE